MSGESFLSDGSVTCWFHVGSVWLFVIGGVRHGIGRIGHSAQLCTLTFGTPYGKWYIWALNICALLSYLGLVSFS